MRNCKRGEDKIREEKRREKKRIKKKKRNENENKLEKRSKGMELRNRIEIKTRRRMNAIEDNCKKNHTK